MRKIDILIGEDKFEGFMIGGNLAVILDGTFAHIEQVKALDNGYYEPIGADYIMIKHDTGISLDSVTTAEELFDKIAM